MNFSSSLFSAGVLVFSDHTHAPVHVRTPSSHSGAGVSSSWERAVTTCCFGMQDGGAGDRVRLIVPMLRSFDLSAPPHPSPPPPPPHLDPNTEWHNLMKFCSLKQVAVCRNGGVKGLCSFSSSVSLNSFHAWINAAVFSWPFSAVTRH